ncbi:MAG: hypothetical protein NVS3B26_23790 [Mycobacteriales bacterium]
MNERITTRSSDQVRPRSAPGKYVLAGAIRCELCGKAMFGATAKNKPYYRCTATRPNYAAPSVAGYPPTYAVREERILAAVDSWLTELVDDDHLDATIAATSPPTSPRRASPRRSRRPGGANTSSAQNSTGSSPPSAPAWTPTSPSPRRRRSKPNSPSSPPSSRTRQARPTGRRR